MNQPNDRFGQLASELNLDARQTARIRELVDELSGPRIGYELSEDQQMLQELAHDFAENEMRPVA
ncbi:MAG: hypothetical protein QGG40_13790, partial [Myxococcota bacterium]|nr:hypothetical protein [Myxococcota bacterium]